MPAPDAFFSPEITVCTQSVILVRISSSYSSVLTESSEHTVQMLRAAGSAWRLGGSESCNPRRKVEERPNIVAGGSGARWKVTALAAL